MPHPLKLASFVIFWYLAAPSEKVIKFSSGLMSLTVKIVNWEQVKVHDSEQNPDQSAHLGITN